MNRPGKGGSWCAVFGCGNSREKSITKNIKGISFHKLPKDSKLRREWILKCHRSDKFNFDRACLTICSTHFKEEDFERDLQAELLNTKPKRLLKKGSIPSQNLPGNNLRKTSSSIKRDQRMMAKELKQKQREIVSSLLQSSSEVQDSINIERPKIKQEENFMEIVELREGIASFNNFSSHNNYNENIDIPEIQHEKNFMELKEIATLNNISSQNYFNENIESPEIQHEKTRKEIAELKKENASLKSLIEEQNRIIKELTEDRTAAAEEMLHEVFSSNQIKLILGQKKVKWNDEEIERALTLRYISKKAYLYVKDTLLYPLPGISSLKRWSKMLGIKRGMILHKTSPSKSISTHQNIKGLIKQEYALEEIGKMLP